MHVTCYYITCINREEPEKNFSKEQQVEILDTFISFVFFI